MQVEREINSPQQQTVSRKRKRAVVFPEAQEEILEVQNAQTTEEIETNQIESLSTYKPPTRLTFNLTGSYRKIPLKSVVKDPSKTLLMNNLAKQMSIVTVEELLIVSTSDIERELKVSHAQVKSLLDEVSLRILPQKQTTLSIEQNNQIKHKKLSLQDTIIDTTLGGGIITKNITEIVGEASSGKTQFCLHLSLHCQLSEEFGGLGGKVLYISTNGDFPASRYRSMSEEFEKQMNSINVQIEPPLTQIFTEQAQDLDKLWKILNEQLPVLIKNSKYNIKLVIIDSLAAIIRSEYENHQAIERSRSLWMISSQLRKLADSFNFAVVVVNQVTDKFESSNSSKVEFGFTNPSNKLTPALGLAWSKCINTRILIRRTLRTSDIPSCVVDVCDDGEEPSRKKLKVSTVPIRELSVLFSSICPSRSCNFVVLHSGIKGIDSE